MGEVYKRLARIAAEPAGGETLNASEYGAWDLEAILSWVGFCTQRYFEVEPHEIEPIEPDT
jgi:hypothetical protein